MALSYASTVIDAPADAVWAKIRDFNGMPDWYPEVIATSEIEDGKAGDQVGAIRSFTLGDGTHLREKLLAHSDEKRSYTYDFQKTPFDVDNYNATIRVAGHGREQGVRRVVDDLRLRPRPAGALDRLLRERDLPERVRGDQEAHARRVTARKEIRVAGLRRADLALHGRGARGRAPVRERGRRGRRRGEPRRR